MHDDIVALLKQQNLTVTAMDLLWSRTNLIKNIEDITKWRECSSKAVTRLILTAISDNGGIYKKCKVIGEKLEDVGVSAQSFLQVCGKGFYMPESFYLREIDKHRAKLLHIQWKIDNNNRLIQQ